MVIINWNNSGLEGNADKKKKMKQKTSVQCQPCKQMLIKMYQVHFYNHYCYLQTPFPFFILTPLGFSLFKFLFPQCEVNSFVSVIVNRDPAKKFWRSAELTVGETGLSLASWICICCFQRLWWPFPPDLVQWVKHTTPEMAKRIWIMSYRAGEYHTAPEGDPGLSGGVDQAGYLRVSKVVAYIYG